MKKTATTLFCSFLLICVALVEPARAIVSNYRQILVGATYAAAAAPGALYAGTATGVKKSVDGGASWTQLPLAAKTVSIAVDPRNPAVLYAATAGGLFKSSDAGQTWGVINFGARLFVTVSPLDSNVVFADRYKSLDGGATWHVVTGLPATLDQSFHIAASADPAIPGFMLAAVNESSYRSVDGGETWQFFWRDFESVAIDPVDARFYYLGGRCGRNIMRYYPGGTALVGPDHVHAIVVDPTNHGRVFAATDDNTSSVSANFGATWAGGVGLSSPPFIGRMAFDAATGMVLLPTYQGLLAKNSWCPDADNDGYSAEGGLCGAVDCDDANPALSPKQREDCWDGIDNNCNGVVDMADAYCMQICGDQDRDDFVSTACRGLDCNDSSAVIFPGAPEICDWRDNDCDGQYDEGMADADGDGYNTCYDCNDGDAAVFPYALEIALDGIDQDCDGYDQSILVTKASYSPEKHGAMNVRAQSAYGADAALEVGYYGSMVWQEKKGYWELVTTGIGDNPGFVTVCGSEGCVEAPLIQ